MRARESEWVCVSVWVRESERERERERLCPRGLTEFWRPLFCPKPPSLELKKISFCGKIFRLSLLSLNFEGEKKLDLRRMLLSWASLKSEKETRRLKSCRLRQLRGKESPNKERIKVEQEIDSNGRWTFEWSAAATKTQSWLKSPRLVITSNKQLNWFDWSKMLIGV